MLFDHIFTTDEYTKNGLGLTGVQREGAIQAACSMQTWPPGYENTSAVSIRISIIKQAMDSILTLLVKNMNFLRWHNSLAGELCPNVFLYFY